MSKKINQTKTRDAQVKDMLLAILAQKGLVYTCGLLMGIIARFSKHDYTIYRDIALHYEKITGDEVD